MSLIILVTLPALDVLAIDAALSYSIELFIGSIIHPISPMSVIVLMRSSQKKKERK